MRIFEKLIIFHPSRRIIIPPPFLDHLTCPKHMEDNRKRLTYTQTQYIIAIIWHRIIREASVLTFYPRGSRSPPPGRTGFPDPRYERVKDYGYSRHDSPLNASTVGVVLDLRHKWHICSCIRIVACCHMPARASGSITKLFPFTNLLSGLSVGAWDFTQVL